MWKRLHSSLYFLLLILLLITSLTIFYVSRWLQVFPKMYIPRVTVSAAHSTPSSVSNPALAETSRESDAKGTVFSGDAPFPHNAQPPKAHETATSSISSQVLSTGGNLGPKFTSEKADLQPTNRPEVRRRSLLIYGADRSGTTFTTKMFAEDPQLLTVYEPLWITSAWNKEDPTEVAHWKRNVLDVLRGILSCKFADSQAGTRFLSHTQRRWSGAFVRNPFTTAAFCNGTCQDLSKIPDYADHVCMSKYKHSVTKIGEPRMPDQLMSTVVPDVFLENPETDVRVIQLVRDPRASFNSRIKLGWMEEFHDWHFPITVRNKCAKLAENTKLGRELPTKWRQKYLEVHYEDLAKDPIETTKKMYRFAGFEMALGVIDWVVRNTSPTKEELLKEMKDKFSSVRNSSAVADQWRREAPIERTKIIEKHCKEAFELLGLEKVTK